MPAPLTDTDRARVRGAGRPAVAEQHIVREAIALMDEEGPDALTLRALATRLGSSTATLYRHFESRASLVDDVVDAVLGEVELGSDRAGATAWTAELTVMATSLFEALERHRNVAPLMLERIRSGPNVLRIQEQVLLMLLDHGFSASDAVQTYATVGRFVLGFGVQTKVDGRSSQADVNAIAALAERYPTIAMVASVGPITLAEEFRFGLAMLLTGIAASHR